MSYSYSQHQGHNVYADIDAAATSVIVPKTANHQIWIQRIAYGGDAEDAATVVDDGGSDITIAAVLGGTMLDFGPKGTPIRVGNPVSVTGTLSGRLHIEAYEILANPVALSPNI